MKKVFINKTAYNIDSDMGTQDVAWLAMAACYEHGLNSYPISRFLPIMATNKEGEILHPKMVINKYEKKIGEEIHVKIRNKSSDPVIGEMSKEEQEWYNQAFTMERFMMEIKIRFVPSNEFKKDYVFSVACVCNYKIMSSLSVFFPGVKEEYAFDLDEIGAKNKSELYQGIHKLPIGSLDFSKITYKDRDGNVKESVDNKNKITIEKFPEPLLMPERENIIRQKESMIKSKELALRQNIKKIEEEKQTEEQRLRELQDFLQSLPFSLDEIFEYANKEIQDATKDLIAIFAHLEKDEYLIFKKLSEIFNDYCKFYDDSSQSESIDIEALMSFYKNYLDHKKEDLSSLLGDLQKFYLSRIDNVVDYNFLEFVFSLIYLLYNIQIYKTITIENEFQHIFETHEEKLKSQIFVALYREDLVTSQITSHIEFLKKLFMQFSVKKFENYYEMPPQQYINFVKDISSKKGFDAVSLFEKNSNEDICFFDFLEKIVWMADKVYEDSEDHDLITKVSEFLNALESVWGEPLKTK